jgi:peptide/nickel transport system substrate-binding protein
MYVKFQNILAEEVPAIFLYSPTYTYAVSRRVQGVEAASVFSPADRFSNVESWYIDTKKIWQ